MLWRLILFSRGPEYWAVNICFIPRYHLVSFFAMVVKTNTRLKSLHSWYNFYYYIAYTHSQPAWSELAIAIVITWEQGQKFGENPFLQRFLSTKLQESKWILVNISVCHTKSYGENPWILAKFHWENPKGFSYLVANFWPCENLLATASNRC